MGNYKLTDPNSQNGLNILLLTKLSMKKASSSMRLPATWLLQPH